MKTQPLFIVALALGTLVGCRQHQEPATDAASGATVIDTTLPQAEVILEEADPVEVTPTPIQRKESKKAVQQTSGKAETIYVETEGAQGRVWGHVTMRGDRGTGTIHDWDENTLTVNVTRHGNELFAVDQNSRQYVFKLKQK